MRGLGFFLLFAGAVTTALCYFYKPLQEFSFSYSVGFTFFALNTLSLLWASAQIMFKKSCFLAKCVILFKWTIIGLSVYLLMTKQYVQPLAFSIGLLVALICVVGWIVKRQLKGRMNESASG